MKEFDLELAKKGASVCTRNGRHVRILCFDRLDNRGGHIVALVKNKAKTHEMYIQYTDQGRVASALSPELDLMME